MKLKMITGVMMILILMSMLTIAFNVPPILADASTAEHPDDNSTIQKTDGDKPLNRTDSHESFASEGLNRNASAKENPNLYSVDETGWNSNKINEWADFAKVDCDSAELVIGVNNEKPNSHEDIKGLIDENGGDLVGTVSMGDEIKAMVAGIPLPTMPHFATEVQAAGLSRYIEPNIKFQTCFIPNDSYWSYQWGPRRIEADYAWNTTIGDPSVLVAVIDTGIDYNHPDLAANYVPLGYDWVNDDTDPMDDHGHGTHCAGIIAAVIDNSIGVAGLAQVNIIAEKGINAEGWGTEDDLANAIIHAVDQGANILSNSWISYGDSILIHEAVKYAYDHGVLVVAAAGNDATSMKSYPAGYDEVISVTATDEYDSPAWFTNFGDWVELAAPGVDVYSTFWDNTYAYKSGTSMAAPHVAGVAALILSQFPSMTGDQVRLQLRFTADDLGDPGFDDYYGYGRINARKAVEQAPPDHDLLILDWETPRFVEPGGLAIVNTTIFNFGTSNETNIQVQLLVNSNIIDSATIDFLETATSETVQCSWTPTVEETYNLTSYVVPVPNEILTSNNVVMAMVDVGYFKYLLFDQTHWTDSIVMYDTWANTLSERGYVVDVHTSGPITLTVLADYVAFVIPQAHDPYSLDELSAIQSFVIAGGGLLVIGDDEPSVYTDLTVFAGISWVSGGYSGITTDVTPHEVTQGVTSVYLDAPIAEMFVSGCAQDLVRDPMGGIMLAVSEQPGRVIGFADEDSLWDYGITQEDNLLLANNMIDWLVFQPEHDLAVILGTPPYVEPGDSSLLNVTVRNRGLSNETDVELFLFINGTIVKNETAPELVSDSSYTMDYLWTPAGEKVMYNVTGYAVPVENETVTANNLEWAYVYVGVPVKAFALDSAGTDNSGIISTWQLLTTNWYMFGEKMTFIDYTTLNIEDLTYEDLAATDADVLIISCASDQYQGWEFTDSEIEAIGRYVQEGHGLIATSGTFYEMVPNNNKLAPLFGLNETITWHQSYTDLLHIQDPTHPLFDNVPNPYTFPGAYTAFPSDGQWDSNELAGGEYVALGHFQESAIVVYRGLVYISPLLEYGIPPYYHHHLQLLYNAITWSSYQKPQHELIVSLEVPPALKPGESALLNATVSNMGLSNETYVELQLLINGGVVNSTIIPELWAGDSHRFSHLWTPTTEGIYNVTAYATPVPGEDYTSNNVKSVSVIVTALVVALFENVFPWEYPSNEEALDLYGIPYVVFSSNDFGSVDLSAFSKVVIASDQDQTFYGAMNTYRWWFEDYVSNGGVLEIHAADWGWHGGGWIGILPGGLQWVSYPGEYVTIVDPMHPVLLAPNPITEAELDEWHAAVHGYFSAYPADSRIVITEDSTGMPAYLEFGYGAGFIVASSQTLEWAHMHGYSRILENSLLYAPVRHKHDLAVILDAPKFLEPGESTLLNATVLNRGLSNETDVELFLLINGTIVNNKTIPVLVNDTSDTINYTWSPTEGIYNVTAYAPPVPNETVTQNNLITEIVTCMPANWILLATDPDEGVGTNLKAIYGQLYSDIIYFKVEHYRPWTTINDINTGIFIDADQDPSTGLPDGFYPSQNTGIGADYLIVVGFEATQMWKWDPIAELWDLGNPISLAYLDAPDGSNVFVVGVVLASVETAGILDCAVVDVISDWDWMPDAGHFTWFLIRYEHELTVFLETPQRLQPGETSLLNATGYNVGLNNETNVELQLLINGTIVNSVTIPELVNGTSYTIDYLWTPTVEATYNVTAYALPVPDENVTANNVMSRMIYVRYVDVALISDYSELLAITGILDSMGIGYDIYNDNSMYLYTEDLDLLLDYPAVIFYTDYRHITSDEYTALESYLSSGGNLLITGYDSLVSDDLLRDIIRSATMGDNVGNPDLYVVDETHPIMSGPYGSFPAGYHISGLSSDCDAVEADTGRNAITVAELADGYDKIIATDGLPGKVVYWNGIGPDDWMWNVDCEAIFKNAIAWFIIRYEHDLAVTLKAPDALWPGDSSLLHATVYNRGLNNETTVELFLLINGTTVANATTPELLTSSFYRLDHLWTPTVEGIYNITAYALPVPGENVTANNMISVAVLVQFGPSIRVSPSYIEVPQYELFNVSILIENMPEDPGVMGVEFKLTWNSSVLEGVSMVLPSGHFMEPDGDDENLWILKNEIDNAYGRAWYAITFLDINRAIEMGYAPKSGSGTLAVITFNSTALGETDLHFQVTIVADPQAEVIPTTDIDGTVCVYVSTLQGDINGDGIVDIYDVIILGGAFGSEPGHPRWNPDADLNSDVIIDIYDAIILAGNFQKTI